MSDRVCVRGCVQEGVHYAACPWDHVEAGSERAAELTAAGVQPCSGCAAQKCRDGSMICDRCFGRMRRLLDDAPDLQARLRALADPAKSTWNWDRPAPVATVSTVAPAPVGDDLLDAILAVDHVVEWWVPVDLRVVSNDRHQVLILAELLLDRHQPVDGMRPAWSVQDAVDRWGVERRDRSKTVWEPDVDGEIATFNVHEHGDPLVSLQDAAALVGETRFKVARWERKGLLARAATIPGPRGSRKAMYRLSEVRAVWEREGATA